MAIQNTFTNDNVMVDKMLGRSYDVVKEVYNNLDAIKGLNENQNVNTLVQNYNEVKKVLDVSEDVTAVASELDNVKAAPTYAAQAQTASTEAKTQADTAKTYAEQAGKSVEDMEAVQASIEENMPAIQNVSDNMDSVVKVSNNMDNITNAVTALGNSDNVTTAKTIVTNLETLNKIVGNLDVLTAVARDLIDSGELTALDAVLQEIEDNLKTYESVLADLQEVETSIKAVSTAFDTKVTEGVKSVTDEGTKQIELVKAAGEELTSLVQAGQQSVADAQEYADICNQKLLKIRDLYHLAEENINSVCKKALGKLMYEADRQILRLRDEGDSEVDRVHNSLGSSVDEAVTDFEQKAEEVKNQKAEELGAELDQKAEEVKQELQQKVDEVNFDITELTERVENVEEVNTTIQQEHKTIQNKIEELAEQVVTQSKGDILIGYKDYSQSTNVGEMVAGTTYINALDSEGNYIQLSEDNMQPVDPSKEIAYFRYYIKSESGQVTYIDRKVEMDLTNYVQYDTEGNIVLPNNIFFQGKSSEGVDTNLIGIDAQDNIVVGDGKKVINLSGSDVTVNGDSVVTDTELETARAEITQEITEAIGDIPTATTEVSGIVELATKEEAIAGTDTTKAVTPEGVKSAFNSNLEAALGSSGDGSLVDSIVQLIAGDENLIQEILSILKDATTEQKGVAELATVDEVKAGTDTARVITPSALVQALPDILTEIFKPKEGGTTNTVVQQITNTIAGDTHLTEEIAGSILEVLATSGYATETNAGVIRIATTAEVTTGTDNTTAVTPAKLKGQLDPINSSITGLEEDVQDAVDAVDGMKNDVNTLKQNVSNLQTQVSNNVSNISNLTQRVTNIEQGGGGGTGGGGNANVKVVTELPASPEEYEENAIYYHVSEAGEIIGVYIKPTGSETVNSIDYSDFLKLTEGLFDGDINFSGNITFSGSVGKDAADSYESMQDTDLLAKGDIKDVITEIQNDIESLQTGGVVSATTEQQGIAELATQEEVNTGTDNARIVTPATLKGVTDVINQSITNITNGTTPVTVAAASTEAAGIVELATPQEVTSGTANKVVTADSLKTVTDTINTSITNITNGTTSITLPDASTTQKGMVELADADEISAGTATDKVVTVKDVMDMITTQIQAQDVHHVVASLDDITTESADGVYLVTGA